MKVFTIGFTQKNARKFFSLLRKYSTQDDKKVKEMVLSLVSKYAFEIDVAGISNETQKLMVINRIERICKQENERSMLLEELIEDTIKPFLGKKKLFKQLIEELGCEVTLSCVIYCESSKVNPSISPSKEVVKFLGEVNIDLEYSLYC